MGGSARRVGEMEVSDTVDAIGLTAITAIRSSSVLVAASQAKLSVSRIRKKTVKYCVSAKWKVEGDDGRGGRLICPVVTCAQFRSPLASHSHCHWLCSHKHAKLHGSKSVIACSSLECCGEREYIYDDVNKTSSLFAFIKRDRNSATCSAKTEQPEKKIHGGNGCSVHKSNGSHPAKELQSQVIRKSAELLCTKTGIRYLAQSIRDNEQKVLIFAGVCMASVFFINVCSSLSFLNFIDSVFWRGYLGLSTRVYASIVATTCTITQFLGWLSLLILGVPSVEEMILDVSAYKFDMDVLMSLGAFSSAALGTPVEGALLLLMFRAAHVIEHSLVAKTEQNVGKAALELSPPQARRATKYADSFDFSRSADGPQISGIETDVISVKDLLVGDLVLVRRGEVAPVDGVIVSGRSLVAVEHLTGESVPIHVREGDSVAAGSISTDGDILIRVIRLHTDSTVARISKLADEAALQKPSIERWLDSITSVYSKYILLSSVFLLSVMSIIPSIGFISAARRTLGFLVAASPCALAAAPLSYSAAISNCARNGVVIRGGKILDALTKCDVVAFDKTGTLTTGDLSLIEAECINETDDWNSDIAIAIAAKMEHGIVHPIARALERECIKRQQETKDTYNSMASKLSVDHVTVIPGEGVSAKITFRGTSETCDAHIGRASYTDSKNVFHANNIDTAGRQGKLGDVILKIDDKRMCRFTFEDAIRDGSSSTIDSLKSESGLDIVMLTGDSQKAATIIAQETGIAPKSTYAALSPADKVEMINKLQKQSKRVLMVGEGVNDAPALSAASVGLTLSERASAASVAAADILIVRDKIESVAYALRMARRAVKLVRFNVVIAALGILLASLSSVMGYLPLWFIVFVHEGSTILVCANAMLCAIKF